MSEPCVLINVISQRARRGSPIMKIALNWFPIRFWRILPINRLRLIVIFALNIIFCSWSNDVITAEGSDDNYYRRRPFRCVICAYFIRRREPISCSGMGATLNAILIADIAATMIWLMGIWHFHFASLRAIVCYLFRANGNEHILIRYYFQV